VRTQTNGWIRGSAVVFVILILVFVACLLAALFKVGFYEKPLTQTIHNVDRTTHIVQLETENMDQPTAIRVESIPASCEKGAKMTYTILRSDFPPLNWFHNTHDEGKVLTCKK
jgi:hypothetical protein